MFGSLKNIHWRFELLFNGLMTDFGNITTLPIGIGILGFFANGTAKITTSQTFQVQLKSINDFWQVKQFMTALETINSQLNKLNSKFDSFQTGSQIGELRISTDLWLEMPRRCRDLQIRHVQRMMREQRETSVAVSYEYVFIIWYNM